MNRGLLALIVATSFSLGPASTRLGDSFAKISFLALKAIERDRSEDVADTTRKAIDVADAEANAESEHKIVDALTHMSIDHSINNRKRSIASSLERARKIQASEDACFKPFEESLRAKDPGVPDACRAMVAK